MSSTVALMEALRGSDGFSVKSSDGREGVVEEVWLGPDGEPAALAVGTRGGSRGLLLVDDVESLDPAGRRVAVRPGARILELGAPHPEPATPPRRVAPAASPSRERSLLASIAVLYAMLLVVVLVVTALAFGVPWLVVGHPY